MEGKNKIIELKNQASGNISIEMDDGYKTIAYTDNRHQNLGYFKKDGKYHYFDLKTLEILYTN